MRRLVFLLFCFFAFTLSAQKYTYNRADTTKVYRWYYCHAETDTKFGTVDASDTTAIRVLFSAHLAGWCAGFGRGYSVREKLDCLVKRGIITPVGEPLRQDSGKKYYTTKKYEVVIGFNPNYWLTRYMKGPHFLAPIYGDESIVLTELVEPDERWLSDEEKLQLLLERGVLKEMRESDRVEDLNKVEVVMFEDDKQFVESKNKALGVEFRNREEAVKAAEARHKGK